MFGMLEMSSMFLPINKNWLRYIDNCKRSHQDVQHIVKKSLIKTANEACEFIHNEKLVVLKKKSLLYFYLFCFVFPFSVFFFVL